MKKLIAITLAVVLVLTLGSGMALAWQEGPGTNWWYIDASYGGWKNSVPLVIKLNGDPSAGQTFNVGDTINITGDLHAYAASCAGGGNGAYTEWHLEVNGPSGPDSDSGLDYDSSDSCAEVETITTLSITYPLTVPGTHTVYMSSYAAVSQYWTDVADDYVDALLTFEVVVPNQPPDCSRAYADPACLWPPNHKFVDISIMGVTDPEGDPITITITGITSDEPTASDKGSGGAKHAPDAYGVGTDTASVRAECSGKGDGRVYEISFTASDGRGGECEGSVIVKVPHDQSDKTCPAVDSGQNYDATDIN